MAIKTVKGLILSSLLCTAPALASAPEEDPVQLFEDMAALWVGDFNNDQQIVELKSQNQPILMADGSGKGGHVEIRAHYRLLNMPELAPLVMYVEETKHGDPKAIFRQRVYTFTHDADSNEVRLKLWNFKDRQKFVGAWKKPSELKNITLADIAPMPDICDLILARDGEAYHFAMIERACAFDDRYFSYQARIMPGEYWFRDKIVSLETGEILETAGDYSYHKLDKESK